MAQQPTCVGVRIRTIEDANHLFHAVALRRAPLFTRRLTVSERRAIHTGCVFIWEERDPTSETTGEGIERWTDGRRWSCSRVKNDFLFYQEKLPEVADEAIIAVMHHNRLVKQTYSVYVETRSGRRKWHLVAYYTPDTADSLLHIQEIPELAPIRSMVPHGAYKPARLSRGRTRGEIEPEAPFPTTEFQALPTYQQNHGTFEIPDTPPQLHPFDPYPADPSPPFSRPSPLSSTSTSSTPSPPPRLPPPELYSPVPFRDHHWILENCEVACINVFEEESRHILSPEMKDMAPLTYHRKVPYRQRHELDNHALRLLDPDQWMKLWS